MHSNAAMVYYWAEKNADCSNFLGQKCVIAAIYCASRYKLTDVRRPPRLLLVYEKWCATGWAAPKYLVLNLNGTHANDTTSAGLHFDQPAPVG